MSPSMNETETPIQLTSQQIEVFAAELRRLAINVTRDVRREQYLPALSDVIAVRPLLNVLVESLEQRVFVDCPSPNSVPDESPSIDAAYL